MAKLQLKSIALHGFKGISGVAKMDKRHVILTGAVGAGKTSLIEAFRICAGLPTRFGENGLHKLSTMGLWRADIELSGYRFGKAFSAKGREHFVQGTSVPGKAYETAFAAHTGIDLVPTIDLPAFLSLSGQKRAELFAGLLADKPVSLEEILGTSVQDFAKLIAGADGEGFVASDMPPPAPALELWAACQELVKIGKAAAKSAALHLEALHRTPKVESRNLVALRGEAEANNQRRGAIKAALADIERAMESYQAGQRMVNSLDRDIAKAEQQMKDAGAAIETETAAIETITKEIAKLAETVVSLREAEGAAITARDAAFEHTSKCRSAVASAKGASTLLEIAPEPPDRAMIDAWIAGADAKAELGMDIPGEFRDALVEVALDSLIRPWLSKQASHMSRELPSRLAALADAERAATAARAASANATTSVEAAQATHRAKVTQKDRMAERLLERQAAIAKFPASIEELRRKRDEMARSAQRSGATDDVETLTLELKDLDAAILKIEEETRGADRARAVAGQIESARVASLAAECRVSILVAILDRVQQWRDKQSVGGMEKVLGPLRENVRLVMDGAIDVQIKSSGAGRSTEFDIGLVREGRYVSLDQLSSGESALLAVAFLAAMNRMLEVKTRVLTMDMEALDGPSMDRVMVAIPKLGFDLVMIASNRVTREGFSTLEAGTQAEWCLVECPIK